MKTEISTDIENGGNNTASVCHTSKLDPAQRWAPTPAMHQLQTAAEGIRERLKGLRHQIVDAEAELATIEAELLLETKEQLITVALRAEAEATRCQDALKQAEMAIEIDALTGLPNRAVLLDRLTIAMKNANRHGHRVGLLFVDLDNFKEINDTAGHAAGDDAIKRVAGALTSAVRAIDTVSRHGGDEFLILLSEIALPEDALVVSEKIRKALLESALAPTDDNLSASIGISVYPDHGTDPKTLIERADQAMYTAKKQSTVSAVFDETLSD
jgi:diguanylate cyclase (GGDEF)-like protein